MKLYRELSSWWTLLSAPEDYAEEAAFYRRVITDASHEVPQTLLELGSGGGNNASHLKAHFRMTLVDVSPEMLDVSRALNPECEHVVGDMRTLQLGRDFDAVFVHDAIGHMASEGDLRAAMKTAFSHCRPGGAALFCPDNVRENFRPTTSHGGNDRENRGLRYLEWSWDPDSSDTTYEMLLVYALRAEDGTIIVEHDRTSMGLFARQDWLKLLADIGFEAAVVPFEHSGIGPGTHEVFIGVKPTASGR